MHANKLCRFAKKTAVKYLIIIIWKLGHYCYIELYADFVLQPLTKIFHSTENLKCFEIFLNWSKITKLLFFVIFWGEIFGSNLKIYKTAIKETDL